MPERCRWCRWALLGPLLVLLALALTVGSCVTVQGDVREKSEAELLSRGLADVEVDVGYRDVTLTGPAGAEAEATSAVEALTESRTVTYAAVGPSATTTTAGAATTTAVLAGPLLEVSGSIAGGAIVLGGEVPDLVTRDTLVGAAVAAVGPDRVTDQLTVAQTGSTPELTAAARALAGLLDGLAGDLETAAFRLSGTALTVTGTAPTMAAADDLEARLSSADPLSVSADIAVAPGGVAVAEIADLLALQQITFDSGSDRITAEGNAVLDEIAPVLSEAFAGDPDLRIEIGGHTDDEGSEAANLDLSTRRAEAVLAGLTDRGVPTDRLTTAGYGETRPLADNTTPAGRAANRRIEFTIAEG